MNLGLLIIRLVIGLNMAAHGSQKLFGWFGGSGVEGTSQMMASLGLQPARTQAIVAGLAELGCGLLFAMGLFTPLAAAGIVAVMVVATATVHLPKGYFNYNGGYELPVIISATVVGIATTGPGSASIDSAAGIAFNGLGAGLFALVLGLLGAGAQLLMASAGRAPTRRAV